MKFVELCSENPFHGNKANAYTNIDYAHALKSCIRKDALIAKDLEVFCKNLKTTSPLPLYQIIKYAIRNGSEVSFATLFTLFKTHESREIKSELIWALGYKVQKTPITPDIKQQIKSLSIDDIAQDALTFLTLQLKKQKIKRYHSQPTISQKPTALITKNQQTCKNTTQNHESEAKNINIINIAEALRKRNKKIHINTQIERHPSARQVESGSDLSWHDTFNSSVTKLYERREKGIKEKDLAYITQYFLSPNSQWVNSWEYALEKDIRIAETFMCLSDKYSLSTEIIRKLFLCLTDAQKIYPSQAGLIDKLKLTAIKTIHRCTLRNKIHSAQDINTIKQCLNDSNLVDYAKRILSMCDDEKTYKDLFKSHLTTLDQNAFDYIYKTAMNPARCKELFTVDVIERLSKDARAYDSINTYLEYSFASPLNATCLNNACGHLKEPKVTNKEKIALTLLLTAEKSKTLPQNVVETLVDKMDHFDSDLSAYILMILAELRHTIFIPNIAPIAAKLSDDRVVVKDNADVKFEPYEENAGTTLSSIAGVICLDALKKHTYPIHIQYYMDGLMSKDIQTKILAAKCLCTFAEGGKLDATMLLQIKEYTQDNVYDVSTSIKQAYITGLLSLAYKPTCIDQVHLDMLPTLFDFDDLTATLNKKILEIYAHETKKKSKIEDCAIFDHILLFGDAAQQKEVIALLEHYTQHFPIPHKTIQILENFSCEEIFSNLIRNKQPVTYKILQIYVDHLYLSDNAYIRKKAYTLLDVADHNQDLPDPVFSALECERAGMSIAQNAQDKNEAIAYLTRETELYRLPISALNALENDLNNTHPILLNVAQNKQIIPASALNKLVSPIFIPLIFQCVQNNQILPLSVTSALETMLTHEKVLDIFALQIQKGEQVSDHIIKCIVNVDKTEYIPAICALAKREYIPYCHSVEKALIHGVMHDHHLIVRDSLEALQSFVQKSNLCRKSINFLIKKLSHTDESTCHTIATILNSIDMTQQQKNAYALATKAAQTDDALLDEFAQHTTLLDVNLRQIDTIINNQPKLRVKALQVLRLHKKLLTDALKETLTLLMRSTNEQDIRTLCCELLAKKMPRIKRQSSIPEQELTHTEVMKRLEWVGENKTLFKRMYLKKCLQQRFDVNR